MAQQNEDQMLPGDRTRTAMCPINSFSFVWTIHNAAVRLYAIGDSVDGPTMRTCNNEDVNVMWVPQLYVENSIGNGDDNSNDDDGDNNDDVDDNRRLALRLRLDSSSASRSPVVAAFAVHLLAADGSPFYTSEEEEVYTFNLDEEVRVRLVDVTRMVVDGVVNGQLKVELEVKIFSEPFVESLFSDMSQLIDGPDAAEFADAALTTDDGTRVPVNRKLLAVRSEYFRAMFNGNMVESRQSEVRISGVRGDVMKEVIRYLYTDQAPNAARMATELLKAADLFGIERLQLIAENQLINTITAEIVFDLQALAERYRRDGLCRAVQEFVRDHPIDVMNSEGWRRMVDARKALMTRDGLVATEGDDVNSRKRPFTPAESGDGAEAVSDDESDADVENFDPPSSKRARG